MKQLNMRAEGLEGKKKSHVTDDILYKGDSRTRGATSIHVRGHFISKLIHFHNLMFYLDLNMGNICKDKFQESLI